MAKPIGTLGVIDTLTVGGRVFTDLTNLIILHSKTGNQANCTFRKATGSAGYAVTTAKTLTVHMVRAFRGGSTVDTTNFLIYYLAQTDNDVGWDSATALTAAKYECDQSTTQTLRRQVTNISPFYFEDMSGFQVAATKYLTQVQSAAGSICQVSAFGYEA